ncbi:sugar ABC transporter ATP-binding protein [Lacrimispora sp. NSJ-141]|uniref:Sugar ABC transporter ATP-binding protein n=1 Tax=Lientehia hominis TaxID=2897778 RepID=A0AAP2WAH4_9FIRM|nr:sugar ABC transporter ATP-binding protein [Lientehia hominis]MCD2493362.1 sugar ABC transporter ATP-binding protein [Lientehia hominis]
MANILEMKNISKSFPGVRALNHVDFSVKEGEVHALMGENGAGKSTLIKVLTGIYQPDGGEIVFQGKKQSFRNSHEAQTAGISTVYQELNMIPYLTVSENIYVGFYPKNKFGIDWKRMNRESQELVDGLGLELDVRRQLNSYGTAQQQMTSIARAVSLNARLVVMDEPTSSLDTNEVKMLFGIIRKLKEQGISVVFISHRLDEIFEICDRTSVLKDGEYVGTYEMSQITQLELISKMVGKDLAVGERRVRSTPVDEEHTVLKAEGLYSFPKVNGVSLEIKKGEVLGLAGLLGSGRTETAKAIFGCEEYQSGKIFVDGKEVHFKEPHQAVKAGLAFCTENRREEGVLPDVSVKDNITVSSLKHICRKGFISEKKRKVLSDKYIGKLRIKTPTDAQLLKNLSGGNQQKVILARWLATDPKLIILDEPTRGIDVGAKREVEKLIVEFAEQGISVLFISSELSELVRNCDRIVVLREGQVAGELEDRDINEPNIMQIIAGASLLERSRKEDEGGSEEKKDGTES